MASASDIHSELEQYGVILVAPETELPLVHFIQSLAAERNIELAKAIEIVRRGLLQDAGSSIVSGYIPNGCTYKDGAGEKFEADYVSLDLALKHATEITDWQELPVHVVRHGELYQQAEVGLGELSIPREHAQTVLRYSSIPFPSFWIPPALNYTESEPNFDKRRYFNFHEYVRRATEDPQSEDGFFPAQFLESMVFHRMGTLYFHAEGDGIARFALAGDFWGKHQTINKLAEGDHWNAVVKADECNLDGSLRSDGIRGRPFRFSDGLVNRVELAAYHLRHKSLEIPSFWDWRGDFEKAEC